MDDIESADVRWLNESVSVICQGCDKGNVATWAHSVADAPKANPHLVDKGRIGLDPGLVTRLQLLEGRLQRVQRVDGILWSDVQ